MAEAHKIAFLKIRTRPDGEVYLEHNGVEFNVPSTSQKPILKAQQKGNVARVMLTDDGMVYTHSRPSKYNKNANYTNFTELMSTRITTETKPDKGIEQLLKTAISNKPSHFIISDLKWKFLVRTAYRGKNILMTGPSGCGKTSAAKLLTNVLTDWNLEIFNFGSTQDPRASLIGNTHFNKEEGTYFSKSAFIKAITTPKTIILLDELSRAHPDAWNIIMSVLDYHQRYVRLDEADTSPKVEVAKDVCFIATANIGNEYTATKVMDRALLDRFTLIEMDVLNKEQETENLKNKFSDVDTYVLTAIADIANSTREEIKKSAPQVDTIISTRLCEEMASLIKDGFTLEEAAEVAIYPFFEDDGGTDNPRTFVKQLVQKHIKIEEMDEDTEEIFNTDGDIKYDRPF